MSAPATAMHGLAQQTPVPSRLVLQLFPLCPCAITAHRVASLMLYLFLPHSLPLAIIEEPRAQAQMTPFILSLSSALLQHIAWQDSRPGSNCATHAFKVATKPRMRNLSRSLRTFTKFCWDTEVEGGSESAVVDIFALKHGKGSCSGNLQGLNISCSIGLRLHSHPRLQPALQVKCKVTTII
jgi:hypothetical protein